MNKNRKSTSGLMIIALLGLIIMAFILFSTGGDTQTMKYSAVSYTHLTLPTNSLV